MDTASEIVPYRLSTVLSEGLLAAMMAMLTTFATIAWFNNRLDVVQLVELHAVLAILLMARAWRLHATGRDGRLAVVFAGAMGLLGMVGAAGSVVAAVSLSFGRGKPGSWWHADEVSPPSPRAPVTTNEELELPTKKRVFSLRHVMASGLYTEKMKLIAALSRAPRPELMSLLRDAVKDPDAAVRVQAATVVERFEHRFTHKWMVLSNQVADQPDNVNAWLKLARHCDDYAFLGVADAARITDVRADAIMWYQRALQEEATRDDVRVALMRCWVRNADYAAVAALHHDGIDAFASVAETLWYCEALYGLREFERLRRTLKAHVNDADLEPMPTKVKHAVVLWRGAVMPGSS